MQIKKNIKAPCPWPLCGEFTGKGEFPAQMASNAENVSIWWRHHDVSEQNRNMAVKFVGWDMVLVSKEVLKLIADVAVFNAKSQEATPPAVNFAR